MEKSRLSWSEYFGLLVQVISLRSDDQDTQIGAVIVDEKNRIVSTGYNGTPYGMNNLIPRSGEGKYPFMVHAEVNAIYHAKKDLTNCKIYVLGLLPCNDCTKAILQSGINEVIVVNKKPSRKDGMDWGFKNSMIMFKSNSISVNYIEVPKINY